MPSLHKLCQYLHCFIIMEPGIDARLLDDGDIDGDDTQ